MNKPHILLICHFKTIGSQVTCECWKPSLFKDSLPYSENQSGWIHCGCKSQEMFLIALKIY